MLEHMTHGVIEVQALIGDSTNAVREGRSPSETQVAAELAKLIEGAPQRVAVMGLPAGSAPVRVLDAASAGVAMPPAVKVTTMRMGLLGKVWALPCADAVSAMPASELDSSPPTSHLT